MKFKKGDQVLVTVRLKLGELKLIGVIIQLTSFDFYLVQTESCNKLFVTDEQIEKLEDF